jgi:hypothetical protein
MSGYYGNTLITTSGIFKTHTVYRPDHTFSMRVPLIGSEYKGTWQVDGTQLCRNLEVAPPGAPNPLCITAAAHKVGDIWTIDTPMGKATVTLVQGIQ